jgi:hypothetical protein
MWLVNKAAGRRLCLGWTFPRPSPRNVQRSKKEKEKKKEDDPVIWISPCPFSCVVTNIASIDHQINSEMRFNVGMANL